MSLSGYLNNQSGRLISTLLSLITFATLSFSALAHEPKPLVMGGVSFPPLSYVDDKGSIQGPAIDLLNQIFDELDQPYQWIGLSQNRLHRKIAEGSIDLTSVTRRNQEIESQLIYTQQPWACLRVNIYSAPEQPAISSLKDLAGKNLVYFYYFDNEALMTHIRAIPGIKRHSANKRQSAIMMLEAGRADYYLDFHTPASQALSEMGVSLKYLNIFQEIAYIAAPKNKPGAQALIDRVDQILLKTDALKNMAISHPKLLQQCLASKAK